MEFIGHRISFEGRAPVGEYIRRLQTFPQPSNVTEQQRFLGMANYYRFYLEDMSDIADPLYRLLKRGVQWSWDERCKRAFNELRTRRKTLQGAYLLSHLNWRDEFYIEADASSTGVAALLSQLDENTGKLRPIHLFSSSLSPSQRNYSAGQLEAWSLVAATRKMVSIPEGRARSNITHGPLSTTVAETTK